MLDKAFRTIPNKSYIERHFVVNNMILEEVNFVLNFFLNLQVTIKLVLLEDLLKI